MTRRYRLILEVYEDGHLIRRMEEARDKLDNDCCDGERTIGLLLSFVPAWASADGVAGDGLATLGYACDYLPASCDDDVRKWKTLGSAYDQWGAAHSFASCVDVRIDWERLKCNEVKCEHEPDPPVVKKLRQEIEVLTTEKHSVLGKVEELKHALACALGQDKAREGDIENARDRAAYRLHELRAEVDSLRKQLRQRDLDAPRGLRT